MNARVGNVGNAFGIERGIQQLARSHHGRRFFRTNIHFHLLYIALIKLKVLSFKAGQNLLGVKAITQKTLYASTQFFIYNGVDIIQSAFQRHHFFPDKVHLAIVGFLVHGFPDGFQAFTLLLKSFLLPILIITKIRVGCIIHHAHRIFKANNKVFKCLLGILRKGWPRLSYLALSIA